jgi:DNA-cytosine methyltransferase
MRAAGIDHRWGIEYGPSIAAVAQANGFAVTVADLLDVDPRTFERVDVLHASPPCPNFSRAKTNGQETEHDYALAYRVMAFVAVLRPSIFTLENVYGYRKSESFQHILRTLLRLGYRYRWWHLNAADYGVPQTRKRLILVAARDFVPQRPPATHTDGGHVGMFGSLPPWVGWYEAIEDLIPGLPDSQFADWQLERLLEELRACLIPQGYFFDQPIGHRSIQSPSFSLTGNPNMNNIRAFILNTNQNQTPGNGHGIQSGAETDPAFTVKGSDDGRLRAFVQDGKLGNHSTIMPILGADSPFMTVTGHHEKGDARAFVGDQRRQIKTEQEPASTVRAQSNGGAPPRVMAGGRVVQMTPRCLARFQSFPDSYALPDNRALACRVIGNAVPPLLYRRVAESFMEQIG